MENSIEGFNNRLNEIKQEVQPIDDISSDKNIPPKENTLQKSASSSTTQPNTPISAKPRYQHVPLDVPEIGKLINREVYDYLMKVEKDRLEYELECAKQNEIRVRLKCIIKRL